jgi:hypothetical protein
MSVNQGFGKGHIGLEKAIFGKLMRVRGVRHKRQWIKYWPVLDIRSDGAIRWQTQQKEGKQTSK